MAKKTKPAAEETPAAAAQPYYLQRAHIKDFRSIRDAKVEFKPGLNIIIGKNGAGKSNLVEVISGGIEIARSSPELGVGSSFTISGREEISLTYSLESRQVPKSFLLNSEDTSPYQQLVTIKTKRGSGKGPAILPAILANYTALFAENTSFFYQLMVIHHGLPHKYPVVRGHYEFRLNSLSNQATSADAKLPAFILAAISSSLVMDLAKEVSLEEQEVHYRTVTIVKAFLESIVPNLIRFTPIEDVRVSSLLKVYHDKQQGQFIAQGLVFEFAIAGQWLPFQALSSGTQRIFYIVSELATPNGTVVKLNGQESLHKQEIDRIILLEEPELGIHPDQLYLLLRFLHEQSEKHQLIITTHSPQVLDMLNADELDRITICELDEKKGTQFRKLTKKKIVTAQKFMKDTGYLSDFWLYSSLEEKSQPAS